LTADHRRLRSHHCQPTEDFLVGIEEQALFAAVAEVDPQHVLGVAFPAATKPATAKVEVRVKAAFQDVMS
jgi:hypothetical protein